MSVQKCTVGFKYESSTYLSRTLPGTEIERSFCRVPICQTQLAPFCVCLPHVRKYFSRILKTIVTMKIAVAATLLATASAFSVNKADIGKVRIECDELRREESFIVRARAWHTPFVSNLLKWYHGDVYFTSKMSTHTNFPTYLINECRPPLLVPSLSDLLSNQLLPEMLTTESKSSTLTVLRATPEDKMSSCQKRLLRRKH